MQSFINMVGKRKKGFNTMTRNPIVACNIF